jgi:hypothetical protein
MSWDVTIFKLKERPLLPDEMSPLPMGHAAVVMLLITAAWPSTKWHGAEGRAEPDGCHFEIELDSDDESGDVMSVYLRARRGGDPLASVRSLCDTHGWFAFDNQTGEFIEN